MSTPQSTETAATFVAGAPEREGRYHDYVTNVIPWLVRAVWIGFWCFAVYYVIHYLFPALQAELVTPP